MPNLGLLERGGPCSVARTMTVIGDHWSVLLIRECFYGIRRFGDLQRRLAIASNILTERLNRLVASGVLARRALEAGRYEYRLTEKGLDLYPVPVSTLLWGDRWLAGENGPPVRLTHVCGRRLQTRLACQQCADSVAVSNISVDSRVAGPNARGQDE
jgi:DNA-binding HxlR family transcriptional regulator